MIHEDCRRDLTTRIRDFVERGTGKRPIGRICLLTNLRILGVEFNPVSFYYVFGDDGRSNEGGGEMPVLEAVVAEVANFPWFEQHPYLLTRDKAVSKQQIQSSDPFLTFSSVAKEFHVSPFMPIDGLRYHWAIAPPHETIRTRITLRGEGDTDGVFFWASLDASRCEWSGWNLCKMQVLYPWHSLSVMVGILYEAGKMFRSGFAFFPHPTGATSSLSRAVESVVAATSSISASLSSLRQRWCVSV